jgi:thymidylate synthase (FAD)
VRIIQPSFEFCKDYDGDAILKSIERIGRTCYKSEDRITDTSARKFVKMLIERGHESVLEHESISVRVVCDRAIANEIVRHRIASYSQTSTRYVNYMSNGIQAIDIRPMLKNANLTTEQYVTIFSEWNLQMQQAEAAYRLMIATGASPEIARSVLPMSTATEIVITMNIREFRHFFELRTSKAAHPQMREITIPMLEKFQDVFPVVFDDIEIK